MLGTAVYTLPMSSEEDDAPVARLFTLVIACEVVTVAALWYLGRLFS
jgi:hypothetical protein